MSDVSRLNTFGSVLAGDAGTALQAAYVTTIADLFFTTHPKEKFRTNPANTLAYRAVDALLGRSVVNLAELLKDENDAWRYPRTIRHRDLNLHRHAISHPMTVDWTHANMKRFVAAQRDWKEYRPALVWDVWTSAAEELAKIGCQVRLPKIDPSPEMSRLLHHILDWSKADAGIEVPTADALLEYMQRSATKYEQLLQEYCLRLDEGAAPT
jgi:hypothetical protein